MPSRIPLGYRPMDWILPFFLPPLHCIDRPRPKTDSHLDHVLQYRVGKRRGLNEPPRVLATWRQTLKLRGVGALAGLTGAAPDLIALFVFGTLPNMPPNGGANVSQRPLRSLG